MDRADIADIAETCIARLTASLFLILVLPTHAHLPPTQRFPTSPSPPSFLKNAPFFTNVLGHIQNSCSVGVDGPAVSSPVAARAKAGIGPHRDHRSGIDTDGLDTGLAVSFEGTAAELAGRVYGTTHHVQAFARHHTRGRWPFTR